jgi:hypothetical protein
MACPPVLTYGCVCARRGVQWCQNPQFWVKVPNNGDKTVDLKLVLRRTDKHREIIGEPTTHTGNLATCRVEDWKFYFRPLGSL